MAMTKAERAELDALKSQLALTLALRWSGATDPERLPVPETGYVNGWDYVNYETGDVRASWSTVSVHDVGSHIIDGRQQRGTASQMGRRLYVTRLDALIGLRVAKEIDYAKNLARIDALIVVERASPTETPA